MAVKKREKNKDDVLYHVLDVYKTSTIPKNLTGYKKGPEIQHGISRGGNEKQSANTHG